MPTTANEADATGMVIARVEVRIKAKKNSFHSKIKTNIDIPKRLGKAKGKAIREKT